jgi:hypothetical protein
MPKQRKKADLPTKMCPVCQRPFTWRKKWERNWESVVYCSKRCAGEGKKKSH